VTEHHAAPGPYDNAAEARPAVAHILDSPQEAWTPGLHALLEAACATAGAELGVFDHETLLLLAGQDPLRVSSLAGIIERAAEPSPSAREELLGPPGVAHDGTGWISGGMIGGPG
jgi:hypothetical protein